MELTAMDRKRREKAILETEAEEMRKRLNAMMDSRMPGVIWIRNRMTRIIYEAERFCEQLQGEIDRMEAEERIRKARERRLAEGTEEGGLERLMTDLWEANTYGGYKGKHEGQAESAGGADHPGGGAEAGEQHKPARVGGGGRPGEGIRTGGTGMPGSQGSAAGHEGGAGQKVDGNLTAEEVLLQRAQKRKACWKDWQREIAERGGPERMLTI